MTGLSHYHMLTTYNLQKNTKQVRIDIKTGIYTPPPSPHKSKNNMHDVIRPLSHV